MHSHIFREARRVVDTRDILCGIGSFLYRRSLRYSVLALCFGILGNIANRLGFPGLTPKQAIGLPVLVWSCAFLGGLALKFIPSLISLRLITVAQACDLNLMEDYRKSLAPRYLDRLWNRTFQHEADLLYSEEEKKAEQEMIDRERDRLRTHLAGLRPETLAFLGNPDLDELVTSLLYTMPLSAAVEKTRDGFLISAMYAHRSAEHQLREEGLTGLSLSLFEDWCDGAYFDRSDVKLMEQYLGNPTLNAIREQIHLPLSYALREAFLRMQQRIWFAMVTRRMSVGVGNAVEYLNGRYGTTRFNAQILLWPDAENDPAVAAMPGAREDVLAQRAKILHCVFGDDLADAESMVDRMFLFSFLGATELRLRYDAEYCDGSLGYSVFDDMKAEGFSGMSRQEAFVKASTRDLETFAAYLSARIPEILDDREALRASRIAFHTDRDGLKQAVRDNPDRAAQVVAGAIAEKATYSQRIVCLRQFHELTRIQLQSYKELVRKLGYPA